MYQYELRWAHFDTLDEYEDMKMCQQLMHTKWIADSHEDLVHQIEEANKHKIKSISYMCSYDKPESPKQESDKCEQPEQEPRALSADPSHKEQCSVTFSMTEHD